MKTAQNYFFLSHQWELFFFFSQKIIVPTVQYFMYLHYSTVCFLTVCLSTGRNLNTFLVTTLGS